MGRGLGRWLRSILLAACVVLGPLGVGVGASAAGRHASSVVSGAGVQATAGSPSGGGRASLAAAATAAEQLRFGSLVIALSAGPDPGELALGLADGAGVVVRGGRVTLRLPPQPAGVPPVRWVPDSRWVLYAQAQGARAGAPAAGSSASARSSTPPGDAARAGADRRLGRPPADSTPAPPGARARSLSSSGARGSNAYTYFVATAGGRSVTALPACATAAQPLDQAVAYWCGRWVKILALPADGAVPKAPPATYPQTAARFPPAGMTATRISPLQTAIAVSTGRRVAVYDLSDGQPVGTAIPTGGTTAIAWSPAGALAVAGADGLTLWRPTWAYSAPAGVRTVLPRLRDVRRLRWLADGSAVLALQGPDVHGGRAIYHLYRVPLPGGAQSAAGPVLLASGALGYVLGFSAGGGMLWREEGVAAGVWAQGPPGAGPGPFSLTPVPLRVRGATLPQGCGPRPVTAPAPAAVPASAAPLGVVLPLSGAPVLYRGIAARGNLLFASVVGDAGFHAPRPPVGSPAYDLYASADNGLRWVPVSWPSAGWPLGPMALSPDGGTLAGLAGTRLLLLAGAPRAAAPAGSAPPPRWREGPAGAAFSALAFDPAAPHLLVALGGEHGPNGPGALFLTSDAGRSFRTIPLPTYRGTGGRLVVDGGAAVAAVERGESPAQLWLVPLSGGAPRALALPTRAPYVQGLAVGPGGSVYLLDGGYLFVAASPGGAWRRLSLPQTHDQGVGALAVAGDALYYGPAGVSDAPVLWRGTLRGRDWTPVDVPGDVQTATPAADGASVWVGGEAGPVRIAPDGVAQVRARGIAAPVDRVASAAWDPRLVAASYGDEVYVSTDGGRTFANRTPPGLPFPSDTVLANGIAWTPDGGCLVAWYPGVAPYTAERVYLSGDAGRTWYRLPLPPRAGNAIPLEFPAGSGQWWVVGGGPTPQLDCSAPGRATWTQMGLPPAVGPGSLSLLAPAAGGLWLSGAGTPGAWRVALAATPPATADGAGASGSASAAGAPVPGSSAPGPGAGARAAANGTTAGLRCGGNVPAGAFHLDWGAGAGGGAAPGQLASDPYNASVVYAGYRRTVDGGQVWSAVPAAPASPRERLAFGPRFPGAVLATPRALLRDDGRGWVQVWSAPSPRNEALDDAAPAGPDRFYLAVAGLGLIVARPRALAWHTPPAPPGQGRWVAPAPPARSAPPPPITAAAPSDPRLVYRLSPFGALSVSRDGGRSWSALPDLRCCPAPVRGSYMARFVSALAVSGSDPERLFVGLSSQASVPTGGVWTSADGGRHWEATAFPASAEVNAGGLATAAGSAGQVFAVADYRLYASGDAGTRWTVVHGPWTDVTGVATGPGGELLVAGPGALWIRRRTGEPFTRIPFAVPGWGARAGASALLLAPDGALYAGGPGLAVSTDAGRAWVDLSQPVGDPAVTGLRWLADGALAVETPSGTFVYLP